MGKGSLRGGSVEDSQSTTFAVREGHPRTPHKGTSNEPIGPKGLQNVGNTCYANAALQCLLSTALTHALLDPKASAIFRRYSSNPSLLEKGSGSFDSTEENVLPTRIETAYDQKLDEKCEWLTRELKAITVQYQQLQTNTPASIDWWIKDQRTVDPGSITRHPNRLSQCLRPYQQEDAHEFLRALLSTLAMNGHNKKLSSLFDGLLESAVTCQTCRRPSLTRDRYMDLSLDISSARVQSLPDALQEFTKAETLTGDNQVYCNNCQTKRTCCKGLRLATAPSILVTHFKRFAFDQRGNLKRLDKHVQFPLQLEIGDYMSRVNKARPPPYQLVAVLVHQGRSCESGHYLAYVKQNGSWFRCNDSEVQPVDFRVVLSQQAYILMYEVAEMREKHGYTCPNNRRASWDAQPASLDDFFSKMLCGLDAGILRDCCFTDIDVSQPTGMESAATRLQYSRTNPNEWPSKLSDSEKPECYSRLRRSTSSGTLQVNSSYSSTHMRSRNFSVSPMQSHLRVSREEGLLPPRHKSHKRQKSAVQ